MSTDFDTSNTTIQSQRENLSTNNPTGFLLLEKIADLKNTLLEQHPRMPTLLREIYIACKKHPENVTLLTEDEIRVIVAGLEIQTGVKIAEAAAKSTKKTKKIAADDL